MISELKNLSECPNLNNLQVSHNLLKTRQDIQHLVECTKISVLDLSHNKLEDESILEVYAEMEELGVLNQMGNPILRKLSNYRKNYTIRIKNLRYLDDRPVFPKDRACAEAFARGGREEEKAERERWAAAERKKIDDSLEHLRKIKIQAEQRRKYYENKRKEAEKSGAKADEKVSTNQNSDSESDGSIVLHSDCESDEEAEKETAINLDEIPDLEEVENLEKTAESGQKVLVEEMEKSENSLSNFGSSKSSERTNKSGLLIEEVRSGQSEADTSNCTGRGKILIEEVSSNGNLTSRSTTFEQTIDMGDAIGGDVSQSEEPHVINTEAWEHLDTDSKKEDTTKKSLIEELD